MNILDTTLRFTMIGFCGVLIGCETAQYNNERGICSAKWLAEIPPVYVVEEYDKQVFGERPTGQTKCKTNENGDEMTCTETTTTGYYYVPSIRSVDKNEYAREIEIERCTQQKCLQKYGNSKCET